MRRRSKTLAATVVVAAPLAVLSACGSSSKPAYCSDRSDLQKSVTAIGDVKLISSSGLSDLRSALQQVQSDAGKLADSAKKDFPDESAAVKSSVSTLSTAVKDISSSPSPQQLLTVAADAKNVVTAFQKFKDATDSKCS